MASRSQQEEQSENCLLLNCGLLRGTLLHIALSPVEAARYGSIRSQDPGQNDNGPDGGNGNGTTTLTRTRTRTKRPGMYRVLLLNDDYTPMEFVVTILERFFNKNREDATRIMIHVHQHGVGECGIFTYEVAETKVTQVMDFSRKNQHPLQCIMEKN
jgi:ATP-dependent Clp protease adaptor protein ClpS